MITLNFERGKVLWHVSEIQPIQILLWQNCIHFNEVIRRMNLVCSIPFFWVKRHPQNFKLQFLSLFLLEGQSLRLIYVNLFLPHALQRSPWNAHKWCDKVKQTIWTFGGTKSKIQSVILIIKWGKKKTSLGIISQTGEICTATRTAILCFWNLNMTFKKSKTGFYMTIFVFICSFCFVLIWFVFPVDLFHYHCYCCCLIFFIRLAIT